ncbi:Glycopeptide antibiotics resistance protein [Eubacterium ruminantium]|uniref:Glycopeptide antibiotics resistance protein n=1 Tax=Eubacterium ruminantium TaxID=42322 RepID=A0A1T4LEW4_9FIRM|nr:VanZ family protein [Eubacterium ruminantium]SCW65648.1 Glycopeptide antibiotics resistance protein [Eubacterium ruminantium]SDN26102.1 Glycopeptide antibiotics resistance protein [Eubacterium ruminantium]SJZ53014.1 Glycopeptide antibiotics resistance protein [Eubacterium ruminantium]
MFEISFPMLFSFITVVWIVVRLIINIKMKSIDIKREFQLILVYICIMVISRMVYLPTEHVNGHIATEPFDFSKILPFRINPVPFTFLHDFYDGWQMNIIGNITMFIPVGIVWPICFKELDTIGKAILAGGGFSLFIEISQLLFYNRCTDIDDLILNTTGVTIGVLVYFGIRKLFRKRIKNKI